MKYYKNGVIAWLMALSMIVLSGCGNNANSNTVQGTSESTDVAVDSAKEDIITEESVSGQKENEEKKIAEEQNAMIKEGVDIIYSDPDKALSIFEKLATDGNKDAQFLEGYVLSNIYSVLYKYNKIDYAKAAELYEELMAENPFAKIEYAGLVLEGNGFDKDEEKADQMIREALEEIDETTINDLPYSSIAFNRLGILYENGYGVERDAEKAIGFLKKAVDLGNPMSARELGCIYARGKGVDQDFRLAHYWYWKAIKMGDPNTFSTIAGDYERGRGFDQDYEKAAKWYEKGVELGDVLAINNLGYAYLQGIGVEKDYDKAFEMFTKGTELGSSDAMDNLARCYLDGLGVEKDQPKAVELYQKSIDLDNPHAMNDMAYNYEEGIGVERDLEKAVDLYIRAMELGNTAAMQNIVYTFSNGAGTEQDYTKAREIAEKAVDTGNYYAADFLASLYDKGWGVEKDAQKANDYRTQSAEMKSKLVEQQNTETSNEESVDTNKPTGIEFLDAVSIMFSKPDEALAVFEKEADAGDEEAEFLVAYMYYAGLPNYDGERAKSIFEKLKNNNPYAKLCLERTAYYSGKDENDKKAAKEGMDQAFSEIDKLMADIVPYQNVTKYLMGYYIYNTNENYDEGLYKEAFECFEESSINPASLQMLGMMYYNGDGVKRDMTKSIEYLEKAANMGEAGAADFLGRIYDEGMGVPADPQKADEWFKKAEDLGLKVNRD